jgi:hypothetical protein
MLPAWRAEVATLCRYITRPAIANERLTLDRAGDVVLQLSLPRRDHPCRDVTPGDHAAPGRARPAPKAASDRFHGVLAPNAKSRSAIIPSAPVNESN